MGDRQTVSFKCHKIAGGSGEGKTLISTQAICFYQTDPDTGCIIEKNHDLEGKSIANKILIFPNGKGSSVVQGDGLHKLTNKGTVPTAMVIRDPDTVLVTGAVIWRIPLVDQVEDEFYRQVKNGSHVRVDADKGLITLVKGGR